MAPFIIPETTATIVLDDPPYSGAAIEARVLSLSPATYFGVKQWLGQATSSTDEDVVMQAVRQIAELFCAEGLVSWNLERATGPIPATLEEVLKLDIRLLFAIVVAWLQEVGASVPLPEASPPGAGNRAARRNTKRRSSTAGSSTAASRRPSSIARTSAASSASTG